MEEEKGEYLWFFYIKSENNEQTLKENTQKLEYKAFPEAVIKIFRYN